MAQASTMIIDCAVAGAWSFRDPWDHPRQGQCVRLGYVCIVNNTAFESGTLIVKPNRNTVVTRENEDLGVITLAGLMAEGFSEMGLSTHSFWDRLQAAGTVISFCQPFHIGALNCLAASLGLDISDYPRPRFVDVMVKATPLAEVPFPNVERMVSRHDQWKAPSLLEAHDKLVVSAISLETMRKNALDGQEPIAEFARVQLRAVSRVWNACVKAEKLARAPA